MNQKEPAPFPSSRFFYMAPSCHPPPPPGSPCLGIPENTHANDARQFIRRVSCYGRSELATCRPRYAREWQSPSRDPVPPTHREKAPGCLEQFRELLLHIEPLSEGKKRVKIRQVMHVSSRYRIAHQRPEYLRLWTCSSHPACS